MSAMYDVPLALLLPAVIIGALLVLYCWYDIIRTDRELYFSKPAWALAVIVLVPLGPIAYLLFEKLRLSQLPDRSSEELTTHVGGNLYTRGH